MTSRVSTTLKSPRFDWMQKTIPEDPAEVYEVLAGTLGAELVPGRGFNGYHRSMGISRAGETLAKVAFGGPNGWPNVVTSGAATDDVEPILRDAWDRQQVTRMDSAQDFDEEGGYERVAGVLQDVHERSRLTKMEVESVKLGVRSRTTYLGSPTSRVRVRLYEKGMYEHQLGNTDAPPSWFRLELQVRPTGQAARLHAAEVDAVGAWGFSRWSMNLAAEVMNLDVNQVVMQPKREPDYMRAVNAMRRQYSATMGAALEVEGSWDGVGRLLGVIK